MDNEFSSSTIATESKNFIAYKSDAAPTSTELLDRFFQTTVAAQRKINIAYELIQCSNLTGGYVVISPRMSFMPSLIGSDGSPVFLYRFVELLDELVDYSEVLHEFPTLSHSQINGAFSFLRRLVQFNCKDIDIDEVTDSDEADDRAFIGELRSAISEEQIRVLNIGE